MSVASWKSQRTRLVKKIDEFLKKSKLQFVKLTPDTDLEQVGEDLEVQLNVLDDFKDRLEVLCEKIGAALEDSTPEEEAVEEDEYLNRSLHISELKAKLAARLNTVNKRIAIPSPQPADQNKTQDQLQRLIELESTRQHREPERHVSVNLPKLDFDSFSGDVLQWTEFWDSFSAAVHTNPSLQPVQKLAYLRAKLRDDAKQVIAGFKTTNDNYQVVIDLLSERFGDAQTAITAHYTKIMDLSSSPNHTEKLRLLCDQLEQHLRCLATLGEDVNHRHFISLIMTKLPKPVIVKLEELKGSALPWSVELLRNKLQSHLAARESADRQSIGTSSKSSPSSHSEEFNSKESRHHGFLKHHDARSDSHTSKPSFRYPERRSTAEALFSEERRRPTTERKKPPCIFCNGSHWNDECRKFATVTDRKQQLKGRCFNCLKDNHSIRECHSERPCFYCKKIKSHNRSLCREKFPVEKESSHVAADESDEESKSSDESLLACGERALLQTATVKAISAESMKSVNLRLLFDSGSHRSYISEDAVKGLHLKPKGTEIISVNTFGAKKTKSVVTKIVELSLQLQDGTKKTIVVNVVPQISGTIYRRPVNLNKYKTLLSGLNLADSLPNKSERTQIDILIGSDYYLELLTFERISVDDGLHLLGSKFGWILTGRLPDKMSSSSDSMSMLILNNVNQSLSPLAPFSAPDKCCPVTPSTEDFWSLEAIGIKDPPCPDSNDETALRYFKQTVKHSEGRYQVKWPWREESAFLPSNFELSLGRLKSLVRRLSEHPDLLKKYNNVIQDQLQKGVVEKVASSVQGSSMKHYIPHHAVVTPQKTTTKIRIVYDASAKTRKDAKSLNECLLRGPVILENLCGLLMRFRLHKVAVVADIEKAFLQIGLQEEDRDVVRFLWLKNPDHPSVNDNVQVYRFCRVPFGVISSPFLLGATVNHHLKEVNSPVSRLIVKHMYVDNMITGVSSKEEARQLYYEAKKTFNAASMNLREWTSNSKEFLGNVPQEDRCEGTLVKVLGLNWNNSSDVLSISCPSSVEHPESSTMRIVYKTIAGFFDPLGFCTPVLIRAKFFLQDMWKVNMKWDDKLSDDQRTRWNEIRHTLNHLQQVSIPRWINEVEEKGKTSCSLFCFCDASAKAYAAAVYLHIQAEGSMSQIHLVFSKSRLAPIKRQTIPRLELLAVLIGVRCLKFVEDHLHLSISRKILWTDSQCVLFWIQSSKSQGVFINNRLKEIRSHTKVSYLYVRSEENPADMPTRGMSTEELDKCNLWWHGPMWLNLPQSEWPKCDKLQVSEDKEEQKGPKVLFEASLVNEESTPVSTPFSVDVSAYSDLMKLVRVTAWCLRFISRLRKLEGSTSRFLSAVELGRAKKLWERSVQSQHFSDVTNAIRKNKKNDLRTQLGLHLDSDQIIRCCGRLCHIEMPEETLFPKLLPKNDHFTLLVIRSVHQRLLHSGVSQTLARLRYEYWIPQGRREVQKVLSNCSVCRRWEGGPYKLPPMPPLPQSRVIRSVPFSYTGIDYFGPLFVKSREGRSKVWVCLYTCMTVRAIHMELASDMTAEEFLLCFRRFISRRGTPQQVFSDNGSNFKAGSHVIEALWSDVKHQPDVQSYMSSNGIKWNFIIQFAPWMGGFYERMIGIVKKSLRKTLGRSAYTYVQLQTILSEVEAVVNSRPLCYVGQDFNSGQPITPRHFLSLNPATGFSEDCEDTNFEDPDFVQKMSSYTTLLNSWKKGQRHLNQFWQNWTNDYLLSLRERHERFVKQPHHRSVHFPSCGDVILIKDDNLSRGSWKIAKIIELISGSDGQYRAARLRLPSHKETVRPLALLYPFECSNEIESDLPALDPPDSSRDFGGTARVHHLAPISSATPSASSASPSTTGSLLPRSNTPNSLLSSMPTTTSVPSTTPIVTSDTLMWPSRTLTPPSAHEQASVTSSSVPGRSVLHTITPSSTPSTHSAPSTAISDTTTTGQATIPPKMQRKAALRANEFIRRCMADDCVPEP